MENAKNLIFEAYAQMDDETFKEHYHGQASVINDVLDELGIIDSIGISEYAILESYEKALIYQRLTDMEIDELIAHGETAVGENNIWSAFGRWIKYYLQKEREYKED